MRLAENLKHAISVVHSLFRFGLLKLFHGKNLRFSFPERFSPNVSVDLYPKGKLNIGKKCSVHSGVKIKVRDNAEISLGDRTFMNYGCVLVCRERIRIDEGCELGPNVVIYDHDHDFRCEGGLKARKFNTAPVIIGKDCWIGANTVILRGTTLGEGCVVGAGSVLKGDYPAHSVIVQKRMTEMKSGVVC